MTKSELQSLYREVKKHRPHKPTSPHRQKQGCNTCGRVTWKPGR